MTAPVFPSTPAAIFDAGTVRLVSGHTSRNTKLSYRTYGTLSPGRAPYDQRPAAAAAGGGGGGGWGDGEDVVVTAVPVRRGPDGQPQQ